MLLRPPGRPAARSDDAGAAALPARLRQRPPRPPRPAPDRGPEVRARHLATANGQTPGTVLIDGFVGATWRLERTPARRPSSRSGPAAWIPARVRSAVAAEGRRLLAMLAADADAREVEVEPAAA